jgi:sortase A
LLTAVIVLIFLAGLAVFLYPIVSDYVNSQRQTRVVYTYREDVAMMDEGPILEMLEAARAYNETLRGTPNRFLFTEEERLVYNGLLNVAGRGVIGTLDIDLIGVMLPIYHGTSEGVLQVGIGHYEGSSLPVGGEGTHAVVTGHRGLPSSTLLTNLDRMVIGDTFVVRVLNEVLAYQVDQILVVQPDDLSALGIVPGMDYCTLITCTPYGINSHRLLVRGVRVEDAEAARRAVLLSEAGKINVTHILLILLTPFPLVWILIRLFKRKRKMWFGR